MKPEHKKILTLSVTTAFLVVAGSILTLSKANIKAPRTARNKTKKGTLVAQPKHSATHSILASLGESGEMRSILNSTNGLNPKVLSLGLNAYKWAQDHASVKNHYLTIVDYTIPSKEKRMWVINMNTDKVVLKTLVANGKNSGLYNGTRFSNRPGSLQSSLGIYLTGVTYYGNDGLSMHVHGLQPSLNGNAYSRTIEFHGAWYVSPAFAAAHGRVGRSWGCFALDKAVLPKVVNTIKGGSVVFAYAANHPAAFQVESA